MAADAAKLLLLNKCRVKHTVRRGRVIPVIPKIIIIIIIIIIIYSHRGNTGKKKNVKTTHSCTQCELDYKV